ncbi:MAG TPA: Ig-like domain-containing protein [Gemmatimonadales bacterium]|nr:Ig-like domain-containing protein [Gemmatimonadales bacterium]
MTQAIVSSPIDHKAYVSMVPGTVFVGSQVAIQNGRNRVAVTAPILDGGFDPVAVEAEPGDTLAITVTGTSGAGGTGYRIVPAASSPKVVRTFPRRHDINTPRDSAIRVVFSQPMDTLSLPLGVHLQYRGPDVRGIAKGEPAGGVTLVARFVPTLRLEPSTTYDLLVSTAARSSDGVGVARTMVSFTTEPGAPVLTSLTLYPREVQLATIAPANSVHLGARAIDGLGRDIGVDWLSSIVSERPGVAVVDNQGFVTGLAPGTTVIRSTVTLEEGPTTDSVLVTVATPQPRDPDSDLTGVYDFTGWVTDIYDEWGPTPLPGGLQTAELTIQQETGTGQLHGNYWNYQYARPEDADPPRVISGSLTGSVSPEGMVTIYLTEDGQPLSGFPYEGLVMSDSLILGRFGTGASFDVRGVFTAVRR